MHCSADSSLEWTVHYLTSSLIQNIEDIEYKNACMCGMFDRFMEIHAPMTTKVIEFINITMSEDVCMQLIIGYGHHRHRVYPFIKYFSVFFLILYPLTFQAAIPHLFRIPHLFINIINGFVGFLCGLVWKCCFYMK